MQPVILCYNAPSTTPTTIGWAWPHGLGLGAPPEPPVSGQVFPALTIAG